MIAFGREPHAVTAGADAEELEKRIAAELIEGSPALFLDNLNIIHMNTELRVAWRRGLEERLSKQPHEVVPYKILPFAVESVKKVARSRLELFNVGR